jgi:KaiC/GvpD/RAD55 family RecA-like ATPase
MSADPLFARFTEVPTEGLIRLKGRSIKAKVLIPIWPGVLFQGKCTIIAGLPGDGKSASVCDIVARITKGSSFPCTNVTPEPGYAILITAEDDPEDTLRPRLDIAGADPDRYEVITGVQRTNEKTGELELDTVSLIEDLPKIEAAIKETKAAILVIDPLTSFAASDTNKTGDMRRLLDALAQLAGRTSVCIIIVTHLNKRADARKAMHMIAGSHVIIAAVRAAFCTARDPNDKSRRLMLPLKVNLAKEEGGFAFSIEEAEHPICGGMPRVVWESSRVTDVDADDALVDQTPRSKAAVEKTAEVQTWLRELLQHGAVPAQEIWRQAEARDYSVRRVRSALKTLGAASVCTGYQGPWDYRLLETSTKGAAV